MQQHFEKLKQELHKVKGSNWGMKAISVGVCISLLMSCLFLSGASIYKYEVTLDDNGEITQFYSNEETSDEILKESHVFVSSEDEVTRTQEENQIYIDIDRAVNVSVTADGVTSEVSVRPSANVSAAITRSGVMFGQNDISSVPTTDQVYDGMEIQIQRVAVNARTTEEPIAYQTVTKATNTLPKGTTVVETPGKNGVCTHYYEDTYVEGQLTSSVETATQTTVAPVDEVVLVGTLSQASAKGNGKSELAMPSSVQLNASGIPNSYSKVLTGRGCAYTADPGARTSTGKAVKPGYVAVNPNVIPYGTQMYIVSTSGYVYGYAIAADTGGSCMAGDILVDLFMNTKQECTQFGSQTVNIYLL